MAWQASRHGDVLGSSNSGFVSPEIEERLCCHVWLFTVMTLDEDFLARIRCCVDQNDSEKGLVSWVNDSTPDSGRGRASSDGNVPTSGRQQGLRWAMIDMLDVSVQENLIFSHAKSSFCVPQIQREYSAMLGCRYGGEVHTRKMACLYVLKTLRSPSQSAARFVKHLVFS